MRHLLGTVINSLFSAEADAVCVAERGQPRPGRTNLRNGYRHRDLDTRVGTLDVAVPTLSTGRHFPSDDAAIRLPCVAICNIEDKQARDRAK